MDPFGNDSLQTWLFLWLPFRKSTLSATILCKLGYLYGSRSANQRLRQLFFSNLATFLPPLPQIHHFDSYILKTWLPFWLLFRKSILSAAILCKLGYEKQASLQLTLYIKFVRLRAGWVQTYMHAQLVIGSCCCHLGSSLDDLRTSPAAIEIFSLPAQPDFEGLQWSRFPGLWWGCVRTESVAAVCFS